MQLPVYNQQVRLFGDDLAVLAEKAQEIAEVVAGVPGAGPALT